MINKKLEEYLGCLYGEGTPDVAARRRYSPETDEDLFVAFSDSGHFAIDAHQKIPLSKAFRRLSQKTQVLTRPGNAHIRTRDSHTDEVASLAWQIADILGLNKDLCLAIAKGHDIGHTPFGHIGENFITKATGKRFRHNEFGIIIVQHIERKGKGLNLCYQTQEGMLYHSRRNDVLERNEKVSEEANADMISDKVVYVFHDINDIFKRARIFNFNDFPKIKRLSDQFGGNNREQTSFCLEAICKESAESGHVSFEKSETAQMFYELKKSMYEIYALANMLNGEKILDKVYDFLCSTPAMTMGVDPAVVLALMTDEDVLRLYEKSNIGIKDFNNCSVAEVIRNLENKNIDFTNLDMDW